MEILRKIKTARTTLQMNAAVRMGDFPCVQVVVPNPELYARTAIYQHPVSGEVIKSNSSVLATRHGLRDLDAEGYKKVTDFIEYDPYFSKEPFAAYLVPKDISVGDRVFLEDVIENLWGGYFWGHAIRVKEIEAVWNGSSFELDYDRSFYESQVIVG